MSGGVLVVDKPAGVTSADVVAQVKRRLGGAKVGHTGTLDPMATGVLPLVVDDGTKIAPFLLADDKEYEGELLFGVVTDTLDVTGKTEATRPVPDLDAAAVTAAFAAWLGERQQVPPMYSAIRVDGQRLYDRARAGDKLELEPRPVRIDRFDLLELAPPRARFRVACSKGTYVRSLVRDVGEALGCGATLAALRRTRAGSFTLAQAVPPERAAEAPMVGLAEALGHLPGIVLDRAETLAVAQGKPRAAPSGFAEGTVIRLLTDGGALAAVAEVGPGRLKYLRVLVQQNSAGSA